jgi:hypothetical protein
VMSTKRTRGSICVPYSRRRRTYVERNSLIESVLPRSGEDDVGSRTAVPRPIGRRTRAPGAMSEEYEPDDRR